MLGLVQLQVGCTSLHIGDFCLRSIQPVDGCTGTPQKHLGIFQWHKETHWHPVKRKGNIQKPTSLNHVQLHHVGKKSDLNLCGRIISVWPVELGRSMEPTHCDVPLDIESFVVIWCHMVSLTFLNYFF